MLKKKTNNNFTYLNLYPSKMWSDNIINLYKYLTYLGFWGFGVFLKVAKNTIKNITKCFHIAFLELIYY